MLFVLAQTHELGPLCMVSGGEPGHVVGVDGEQKLIELFPTEADSDMLFRVLSEAWDDKPLLVLIARSAVCHKQIVGAAAGHQLRNT